MKTQLAIFSTCNLRDGTVLLAGNVTGPLLTPGQCGSGATVAGQVKIEILSLGLNDPLLDKPNVQTFQAKILEGETQSLKGATLTFD